MTELALTPQNVANPSSLDSNVIKALANLQVLANSKDALESIREHITAPFGIDTPKEKVKKRPDGFDYVQGSYLDYVAKNHMPLYKYTLLHVSESMGWISVIISLEDRITGNVELGADAARVQVKSGNPEEPTFRDIIDKGNNLKAALTDAIKNAQSRFGYAADIYRKRESVPTEEERKRFKALVAEIKSVSLMHGDICAEQWNQLGSDFDTYLRRWEIWLKKKKTNS